MPVFHFVLPLLFALHPPLGAHELDSVPENLRQRASLIFAGTYVTKIGIAVRRGAKIAYLCSKRAPIVAE